MDDGGSVRARRIGVDDARRVDTRICYRPAGMDREEVGLLRRGGLLRPDKDRREGLMVGQVECTATLRWSRGLHTYVSVSLFYPYSSASLSNAYAEVRYLQVCPGLVKGDVCSPSPAGSQILVGRKHMAQDGLLVEEKPAVPAPLP